VYACNFEYKEKKGESMSIKREIKGTFAAALALLLLSISASVFAGVTTQTGTLSDGATYLIEVPSPWNGTLLLFSHGYVAPGSPNPAQDIGDPDTRAFLLANGFALAGSSYAHTGWAIQEALPDQVEVLEIFYGSVGRPTRTIAWGRSLGGIISAGLIQKFPERFDGALPMCGVLSGSIAQWNQGLDSAFAFKTLLASGIPLQVVNITNPFSNFIQAETALAAAQATREGRARLALTFALYGVPGWFDPASSEPAPTDFATREVNQFLWAKNVDFPFWFMLRGELETRAGGNPSWNTGVDYKVQLAHSVDQEEVEALYAQAGLDLNADLETLNNAARITANPASVDYLEQNIILNGDVRVPVLTMHTSGDGLVQNESESAYADIVRKAGNNRLLRRTFVNRPGHCTFTPAETLTALDNLIQRLDTGIWPDLDPGTLNAEAGTLGPLNTAPPSFFDFSPSKFLRPFDALDALICRTGRGNQKACNGVF
jgi:hypothetical protein